MDIDITKDIFTLNDSEHESEVALCYVFRKFKVLFVKSNGKDQTKFLLWCSLSYYVTVP